MKIVSKDGKTWFEKQRDGKTNIGFTSTFLESLDECWHIMAGATSKVAIKVDQPLCSVETNEGLFSIPSPVSGVITFFDTRAMNFPEKLNDTHTIAQIAEKVEEEAVDALGLALEDLRRMEEARLAAPVRRNAVRIEPGVVWGNAAQPAPLRFFDDIQEGN